MEKAAFCALTHCYVRSYDYSYKLQKTVECGVDTGRYKTIMGSIQHKAKGNAMLTIDNATVETLDATQARPVGKTVLSVTIGDHTFDMLVDENELIQALASQHNPPVKPCMTPAP